LSFKEKFSSYADEKLVEILLHKGDYLPEALEAAADVIAERAISSERMKDLSRQLEEKETQRLVIAKTPLNTAEKVAFVFIPLIGMVVFFIAQLTYHDKGLDQKKRESLTFTLIGVGIWVLVLLLFTSL
ncbi:hypothetical protein N9933_03185, partial [bacterium]|nr:hypothetical protein [bacterium]